MEETGNSSFVRKISEDILDEIFNEKAALNSADFYHHQHYSRFILSKFVSECDLLGVDAEKNIFQLKVIQQQDPYNCGYYSFHNGYLALRTVLSRDIECAQRYYNSIQSHVSFHLRSNQIKRFLEKKVVLEGNSHYPWTHKHLNIGIMERPYMECILEEFKDCRDMGGSSCFISLPELSYHSLKHRMLGLNQLCQLDHVLHLFNLKKTYSLVFLIGVSNHWVCIFANKTKEGTEIFLMDSRNVPLLNSEDSFLETEVKRYYDKKEKAGKIVDNRKWREQMYLQSLKDTKFAVQLIYDCLHGNLNLLPWYHSLPVGTMIESFEEMVQMHSANWIEQLTSYLTHHFPPKIIEEYLFDPPQIFSILLPDTKKRALLWCKTILQVAPKQINHDLIKRFVFILSRFQKLVLDELSL